MANVSADTAPPDPAVPDTARPDPAGRDVGTQWAIAAAHGDPVAQAAFVRHTQAGLWRLAAALVEPSAADDLVQETYLRAFRALPSFEARATARTWLFGIARRVCADHLRAVTRRRRLEALLSRQRAATQEPDPAGAVGAADLVRALAPERRSALVLTQVIGLSYEEAATVEGVPIGTIRSRVARARADLIKALGDTR
ncbi:MAG: sigma-70 family RNA polymerase sigma factor [Micromonosporaceae bacterium]|nr:sigma-70 family RNA polymerase sigma factor [Micromonosporaceae bacterium]